MYINGSLELAKKIYNLGYPLVLTLSIALVLTGNYIKSSFAQEADSRSASCLLIVLGQKAITGECVFVPIGKDGSFQIMSYNGKYFAQVHITNKGVGSGYWNAEPYASHAHNPLGVLYREDGCWVNNIASVCAY